MSGRLETRAELLKLARLLRRDPEEFESLAQVDAGELRQFREQATETMFASGRSTLKLLATAAKLLPPNIIALVGQRAFGPYLSARVTGMLEPDKAAAAARKLPTGFMADISVELDPRRASAVIAKAPIPVVSAVTAELGHRGEYVAMGRFVGHLGDEALRSALTQLDDESVLRISFVLEDKDRLDHIVDLLTEQQLTGVVRAPADAGLWPEALDLLSHLDEHHVAEVAELTLAQEPELLTSLVDAAQSEGLWGLLLPVSRSLSESSRQRFAQLEAVHRPEVLAAIVATTAEQELWPELLPLVGVLPEHAQRVVASESGALEVPVLAQAIDSAGEHELWQPLVTLLGMMSEDQLTQVGEAVAELPQERQQELAAAAEQAGVAELLGQD